MVGEYIGEARWAKAKLLSSSIARQSSVESPLNRDKRAANA
jgi:hypothetical protein